MLPTFAYLFSCQKSHQTIYYNEPLLGTDPFLDFTYDTMQPTRVLVNDITGTESNLIFVIPFFYQVYDSKVLDFLNNARSTNNRSCWPETFAFWLNTYVVPEKILQLVISNRCKIIIDMHRENEVGDKFLSSINEFIYKHGLSPDRVALVNGGTNLSDIILRHSLLNNFPPFPSVNVSVFEIWASNLAISCPHYMRLWRSCAATKKFMCLNGMVRNHRILLLLALKHIVTDDLLFLSFHYAHFGAGISYIRDFADEAVALYDQFPNVPKQAIDTISMIATYLPFTIDVNPARTLDAAFSEIESYYAQSLFNIVTETSFWKNDYGVIDIFITEKSYKPFLYCQLPIILGNLHIVKALRDSGYDMFDDIIDHSYDNECDDELRFCKITSEIARINELYSVTDCNTLRSKLASRLEANRLLLMSKKSKMISDQKLRLTNLLDNDS